MRELEEFFLQRAGYDVVFAEDGVNALDVATTLKPDLVVTEILVPGLDGLSLCRRIKHDEQLRGTRVLVFSILAARARALDAGADAFLRKPLGEHQLVEAVGKLLSPSNEPER